MTEETVALHSKELEETLISCLMKDYSLWSVLEKNKITEDIFYIKTNKIIFRMIGFLIKEDCEVSVATVSSKLIKHDLLDEVGGVLQLECIQNYPFSTAHIDHYCKSLKDFYLIRSGLDISRNFSVDLLKPKENPVHDILQKYAQKILKTCTDESENFLPKNIAEYIPATLQDISDRKSGIKKGIESGFVELDKIKGNFELGTINILAARPGVGKTALAIDIMLNIANEHKSILFFSLEMPSQQIVKRMLATLNDTTYEEIDKGAFDLVRAGTSISTIQNSNIFLQNPEVLSINSIKTITKSLSIKCLLEQKPLEFIVIDYIQLIESSSNFQNRNQAIEDISKGLKQLAMELNVCILALSQLNREVEKTVNQIPELSHLRESGAIEQDAHVVMFICRNKAHKEAGTADIIIRKNRNGALGTATLKFNPAKGSFKNTNKAK